VLTGILIPVLVSPSLSVFVGIPIVLVSVLVVITPSLMVRVLMISVLLSSITIIVLVVFDSFYRANASGVDFLSVPIAIAPTLLVPIRIITIAIFPVFVSLLIFIPILVVSFILCIVLPDFMSILVLPSPQRTSVNN